MKSELSREQSVSEFYEHIAALRQIQINIEETGRQKLKGKQAREEILRQFSRKSLVEQLRGELLDLFGKKLIVPDHIQEGLESAIIMGGCYEQARKNLMAGLSGIAKNLPGCHDLLELSYHSEESQKPFEARFEVGTGVEVGEDGAELKVRTSRRFSELRYLTLSGEWFDLIIPGEEEEPPTLLVTAEKPLELSYGFCQGIDTSNALIAKLTWNPKQTPRPLPVDSREFNRSSYQLLPIL